jgi:hypothetical protein
MQPRQDMDTMTSSPFALLDAHGSLRLVTDAVHEDDALCLALACRALRDALGARFPACPRAGCREVATLAARVTADGCLDLCYDPGYDNMDYDGYSDDDADHDAYGGLTVLPEGISRLAYLPPPGLRKLDLGGNEGLVALPEGLWSLTGLAELDLHDCGLKALPEEIGGLVGLRRLDLAWNTDLRTLPAGLCALVGLEELHLMQCRLRVLPEGIGGLIGLRTLDLGQNLELRALPEGVGELVELRALYLSFNQLTALPAGIGRLPNLQDLGLRGCPGLAAFMNLQEREGLPALLAHLAVHG